MSNKWWPIVCGLLLCVITSTSSGQQAAIPSPALNAGALTNSLDDLLINLPKWKAAVARVNADALPIQYKEGKTIDVLKTSSLGQLNKIETLATSLKLKPTASDSVQLLLDLEDLYGGSLDHLGSALILLTGADGKSIEQAVSWGDTLSDISANVMEVEKRIERPVMGMLIARDAPLETCKDKLTQ